MNGDSPPDTAPAPRPRVRRHSLPAPLRWSSGSCQCRGRGLRRNTPTASMAMRHELRQLESPPQLDHEAWQRDGGLLLEELGHAGAHSGAGPGPAPQEADSEDEREPAAVLGPQDPDLEEEVGADHKGPRRAVLHRADAAGRLGVRAVAATKAGQGAGHQARCAGVDRANV